MNSLVSGALGFTDFVGRAAEIAKILFIISMVVSAGLLFAELVAYLKALAESLNSDG
jgi:uncharacterized membrane protein YtjA (UPF0391 family)